MSDAQIGNINQRSYHQQDSYEQGDKSTLIGRELLHDIIDYKHNNKKGNNYMDERFSLPDDELSADALKAAGQMPSASTESQSPENNPGDPRDRIIQEQNEVIERLRYENTHDELTGLLNKKAWKRIVEQKIAQGEAFGIAFVDLDGFKQVNDRLGHERADELLHELGNFLDGRFLRKADAIAHERLIHGGNDEDDEYHTGRYGGDEFVWAFGVTANGRRGHDTHQNMDNEYEYISTALRTFVEQQPEEVRSCNFNFSIGIALYDPSNPVDATTLIAQADEAMREEKEYNKRGR